MYIFLIINFTSTDINKNNPYNYCITLKLQQKSNNNNKLLLYSPFLHNIIIIITNRIYLHNSFMVVPDFGGRVLGRSELVDIRPKFSSLCYHLLSALRSDNNNMIIII